MIPAESAHDTVAALGDVGLLQFKDLNLDKSAFQRTYANQVKRCDEMARKIRFFHDQVTKAGQHTTVQGQWAHLSCWSTFQQLGLRPAPAVCRLATRGFVQILFAIK